MIERVPRGPAGGSGLSSYGASAGPGLLGLVGVGTMSPPRLPMLEVVLERLGQRLRAALRDLAGSTVDVEVEPLDSGRLGEHLAALPAQAIVAPFEAIDWGGRGVVVVDGPLVGLAVDLFLGGAGLAAAPPPEGRHHTAIETALVERLIGLLLLELDHALAPVARTRLRPGRIETEPRFLAVDRPAEGCVIAKVGLALGARRGVMEIVLPQGTLEVARGQLAAPFAGDRLGHDPVWARHLSDELWEAAIELEAVLEAEMLPLCDALALEVGSVLPVAAAPDPTVSLRYAGRTMLTGKLGRIGERVAVRIEERLVGNGENGHG